MLDTPVLDHESEAFEQAHTCRFKGRKLQSLSKLEIVIRQ